MASEPFPPLQPPPASSTSGHDTRSARRRRKSSVISAITQGDTGPALATSSASMSAQDGSFERVSASKSQRISKRKRTRGAMGRVKQALLRRTYLPPTVLLAIFGAVYMINPTESNPLHHFIFLSYPVGPADASDPDSPMQYGKGLWDLAFVGFYTIVLSFTREFIMQEMLRPLGIWSGLKTKAKLGRFMEQMYTAVYFGVLGPAGLFVMSRTPVWLYNMQGVYGGMPHLTHEAYFKFYYLFEAAYWTQQAMILVLGLEAPRKDFKELIMHHIITLSLIFFSYRFHFTYMGIVIYTTHDISDFFLAISKSLSYVDSVFVAPWTFIFMFVWIYMRHYINLRVLWSIWSPTGEWITTPPHDFDWTKEHFKCPPGRIVTGGLLAGLQALNLFWLFFILRIVYRFIRYNDAEDDRSAADPEESEQLLADMKAEDEKAGEEKK